MEKSRYSPNQYYEIHYYTSAPNYSKGLFRRAISFTQHNAIFVLLKLQSAAILVQFVSAETPGGGDSIYIKGRDARREF